MTATFTAIDGSYISIKIKPLDDQEPQFRHKMAATTFVTTRLDTNFVTTNNSKKPLVLKLQR